MPRKSISFELDFMIKDILPKFAVKQFDDISFDIKPKNQGLDYNAAGMTGKIFIGINNDVFMQTTGITVSNNNINILLDKNMLQKSGRAYAEVELTDNAGTITSSSFIFDIDPKIGEGGMIPGEYEGFVEKYERLISEFKSQVNSCVNNANTLVNKTINNCNTNVDNKLNTVDGLINTKVLDFEKRFNSLTSKQQQDAEVIDARDGEVSLKARLDNFDSQLEHNAKQLMNIINVEEYNSLADALSVAINNPYSTLYFPIDKEISETLIIPCKTNIKMDGCLILNTTENIPCLVIGDANKKNEDVELQLKVKRKNLSNWTEVDDIGIRIYNLWGSTLNVIHCEKFETGIQLIGNGQGVAHNIINLTNILLNRVHLDLVAMNANGFVNENTFNGGRFTSNFGLSEFNDKTKIGIKMSNNGGNNFNNNVFIRPCFQLGTNGYGVYWDNARMNTIISARVEESDYIAYFGDNCELNNIELGYQTSLDIPYIDNSTNKTNFITSLRNIDKEKVNTLLVNYDKLIERYCIYSNTGSVSLAGISIGRFVSGGGIGNHSTGIGVEGDYLTLSGVVIGNKVDTSIVKKFKVCKQTLEGYEGWVVVKCYDKNGNVLDNSSVRVYGSNKEGEQFSYVSTMGGCYRTSAGCDAVTFTVSDDTYSILVGVGTSASNVMKVSSFSIYGERYCSVFKASPSVKDVLSATHNPTHEPIGNNIIIYKAETITDFYGWIYNGTTWNKLMIGS